MTAALVLGLVLTGWLIAVASNKQWREYRCQKRGHLWIEDAAGFRCRRCKRRF